MKYSDWIVFVDESGDHSLESIDEAYPIFALTFCVIRKEEYLQNLIVNLKRLKFDLFGHDKIVFHEAEIIRRKGNFSRMNKESREMLMERLSVIVRDTDFQIFAIVIDKKKHKAKYSKPAHPYHLAMQFGLERINGFLRSKGQDLLITNFIFEARGSKEDDALELEFRRVCDGENYNGKVYPFDIVMADKKSNCEGLQIADLTARPIGLSVLRPDQPNRAYAVLSAKMNRWGKKVFP
ncbi:DUF3800 domain-containing protein [Metapseudomonas otitidis]|uniref:DUF3800 domain-containing protein n=1 Tax=Metapseudomonas otitidis TaxID=319939 RepID=UPI002811DB0E|nr:DUF3800 domain-containing protein [Pseudomonas otitidis]WMR34735.1 DUF3800 domain-containing protein [Pseudomonas otitidis]